VEYGIGGLILRAEGNSTLFVDGGQQKRKQYIHRVWLKNLTPDSKYSKTLLSSCISFFLSIKFVSLIAKLFNDKHFVTCYQYTIAAVVMPGRIYFI